MCASFLRVAVGLLPVKSGKVLLNGEDVTRARPNRRVRGGLGYVPQGQLCFPQMTTMENLQLVEQHVGFALRSTDSYYVLESGRITGSGEGGEGSLDEVRAAMAV